MHALFDTVALYAILVVGMGQVGMIWRLLQRMAELERQQAVHTEQIRNLQEK